MKRQPLIRHRRREGCALLLEPEFSASLRLCVRRTRETAPRCGTGYLLPVDDTTDLARQMASRRAGAFRRCTRLAIKQRHARPPSRATRVGGSTAGCHGLCQYRGCLANVEARSDRVRNVSTDGKDGAERQARNGDGVLHSPVAGGRIRVNWQTGVSLAETTSAHGFPVF